MNLGNRFKFLVPFFLMVIACSPEAPKVYYPAVKETSKQGTLTVDPRVDILFIVDDSGSMSTHQNNLAKNISKFTSEFTRTSFIQYNIGVITTDNEAMNRSGRLVGAPKIVTKNTPNLDEVLGKNLKVGTNGSAYEKIFDPLVAALSPPLVNNENQGFYRTPARLAIVMITDAEDQSEDNDEDSAYSFLLNLKGGNSSQILGYGVIVPTNDNTGCSRDQGDTPVKLEKFLGKMSNAPGNIMSLCSSDYGNRIGYLARNIVEEMTTIRLNRVPYVPSIKVMWGNRPLEADAHKGWAFDAHKNAVVLGDQINWYEQPIGTPITIDFEVAVHQD